VVGTAPTDLRRETEPLVVVEQPLALVEVRRRAGIGAGVAVAVGLTVLIQAVVHREGQEPVFVVPPGDDVVEDEAVGLQDVDRVELETLDREVAEVQAIGPFRTLYWPSTMTSVGRAPVPSICRSHRALSQRPSESVSPKMPMRF
jgi:hypothetical protein